MSVVDTRIQGLNPAKLFGGDNNSYVLWLSSRDPDPQNLGKVIPNAQRSWMRVSTELQRFGMFVAAEPHYLLAAPSAFAMFEDQFQDAHTQCSNHRGSGIACNYEGARLDRATFARVEIPDLKQALTAFRLAQRARLDAVLPEDFENLQQLLNETLRLARTNAAVDEVRESAGSLMGAAEAETLRTQLLETRDSEPIRTNEGVFFQ